MWVLIQTQPKSSFRDICMARPKSLVQTLLAGPREDPNAFGRIGSMFASTDFGYQPDIILCAECERLLRTYLSKALFDAGLYCRANDRGDP